ncbi:MAG: phosphatase PAP2 family protein [Flavobacteriales bacterium]|nr:phosphatase PAP2 family protein [Flavobacteriales bacterium]
MKRFASILLLLITLGASAQEKDKPAFQTYQISDDMTYTYPRPKLFNFLTGIPKNYANLGKEAVKKENLKWWGLTALTTGMLYAADEELLDYAENLQDYGLEKDHDQDVFIGMFTYPRNNSAYLYYLGHGNTSLLIGLGFLSTGALKKDYRAIHTSSEIVEGILTLGVLTQGLKRVFGRESPYVRTQPRGRWDLFPNLKTYAENTPHYDAMPSGHVATLTSTVTIIAKNYPEVKWIRPVGYTMIGVLSIEMMNSGVHYASDYPLGILIGYSVGSIVANSKIKKEKTEKFSDTKTSFHPQFYMTRSYGDNLVGVVFSF